MQAGPGIGKLGANTLRNGGEYTPARGGNYMPSAARQLTKTHTIVSAPLEHKKIARLAYSYWEGRGCPDGSPEQDWFRAEEELRRRQAKWKAEKDQRRSARPRTSSRIVNARQRNAEPVGV